MSNSLRAMRRVCDVVMCFGDARISDRSALHDDFASSSSVVVVAAAAAAAAVFSRAAASFSARFFSRSRRFSFSPGFTSWCTTLTIVSTRFEPVS